MTPCSRHLWGLVTTLHLSYRAIPCEVSPPGFISVLPPLQPCLPQGLVSWVWDSSEVWGGGAVSFPGETLCPWQTWHWWLSLPGDPSSGPSFLRDWQRHVASCSHRVAPQGLPFVSLTCLLACFFLLPDIKSQLNYLSQVLVSGCSSRDLRKRPSECRTGACPACG